MLWLLVSHFARQQILSPKDHGKNGLDCAIASCFTGIIDSLTLIALGFFLPVQNLGGREVPSAVKLDPDILESWNLQGW